MAIKQPLPKRTPGYEPAKGFPDPNFKRPEAVRTKGAVTHYPHRNGTVCGLALTDAGAYDPVDPTCEKCATWLEAVRGTTAGAIKATQERPGRDAGKTDPPADPK